MYTPGRRFTLARILPKRRRMAFQALRRLVSNDLAIDLGTANTLVVVRGRGIVINEPSIVGVRPADHAVVAVGREAKAMLGRTPDSVSAIRPLRDGVIADVDITEKMLHHLLANIAMRLSRLVAHVSR